MNDEVLLMRIEMLESAFYNLSLLLVERFPDDKELIDTVQSIVTNIHDGSSRNVLKVDWSN